MPSRPSGCRGRSMVRSENLAGRRSNSALRAPSRARTSCSPRRPIQTPHSFFDTTATFSPVVAASFDCPPHAAEFCPPRIARFRLPPHLCSTHHHPLAATTTRAFAARPILSHVRRLKTSPRNASPHRRPLTRCASRAAEAQEPRRAGGVRSAQLSLLKIVLVSRDPRTSRTTLSLAPTDARARTRAGDARPQPPLRPRTAEPSAASKSTACLRAAAPCSTARRRRIGRPRAATTTMRPSL